MQSEQRQFVLKDQAGYLWTWWKGNPLPILPSLPDFIFQETNNIEVLAKLMDVSQAEVMKLLQEKHRPYLAYLEGDPVAFGWSALVIPGLAMGESYSKFPL